MPAETILSGFRNAHSGPGFESTSIGNFTTCRTPCDYLSNFQIVHTMVNPCGPDVALYTPPPRLCSSRWSAPCAPPLSFYTPKPMSCVRCTTTTNYQPDQVVIRELADDECQEMGLCGYQRPETECRAPRKVYTSLPGLGGDHEDPPKPWRDPCGGRIYYRLSDNDFIQQWGSPS